MENNIGKGFLSMMGMAETKVAHSIQMIHVDNLVPHEKNLYIVEDTSELEKAIEAQGGVKQNLIVTPCADKYKVISGHRRRQSVKNLLERGEKVSPLLPCRVEEYKSESEELINLILMNSTTRILSEWEKIEQYKQLRDSVNEYCSQSGIDVGDKRKFYAKLLQTNPSKIGKYNAIENNLTDECKNELKAGNIGVHTAYEASSLPSSAQKELHREKGSKITLNDVREKKAEVEATEDLRKLEGLGQMRIAECVVENDVDEELSEVDVGYVQASEWFIGFLEKLIEQRKRIIASGTDRNKFNENCIVIMSDAIKTNKAKLEKFRGHS